MRNVTAVQLAVSGFFLICAGISTAGESLLRSVTVGIGLGTVFIGGTYDVVGRMNLNQRIGIHWHLPHMKKVLPLGLFFSCCLALFFQIGHAAELDNASILLSANQATGDNPGSRNGRASGQLVLAEKLGIGHPDQVVDFDYSTVNLPFYVTEADDKVIHHQTEGNRISCRTCLM